MQSPLPFTYLLSNLDNSDSITLVSPKGEVSLDNAVIIAERHIHMTNDYASQNSFYDNQKVGQLMSRITHDLFPLTELYHHGPEDLVISIIKIVF